MKILESPVIISCNNCDTINVFNENKDIVLEEYSNKEIKCLREIAYCSFCNKKIIISENIPDNKTTLKN